ncbi:FxSxx-COOH system tetratricopeptide repeat protein [Umezawaea endophytica]|uniref:FxSxx-COOH system tetratricopeptide repeat protein n=1 Tax=Umezawaea endophytica TaxID=1654476 RepID=A0A9X2ZXT2_9PSEU|nr:FxSxx-COOH system tetratricopeptide repeat protein [Umezawaea endophytica]MCS7475694.1 FxSxx-COOH system tetratricopeptide repeat protein [Umezawaea endophytica]
MLSTHQVCSATDAATVNQAARDLHVHTSAAQAPGLGSLTIPDEVAHTVRGRDTLLDELEVVVKQGNQVVVLHGNGGYGKTTVAVELARRLRDWVHVWWVDATSGTSVTEGLREVAVRAGAPRDSVRAAWSGQASAPDLLWKALDGFREPWLLVLDNADDARLLVADDHRVSTARGWLRTPRTGGAVVVTSRDGRRAVWGHRPRLHPVTVLEERDGAAVLRELAPGVGTERNARDLVAKLGGLPLALSLAGNYLGAISTTPRLPGSTQPRSYAEYGTALDESFRDTTTAAAPGTELGERELLSRTWELSLAFLTNRGHFAARPLMRLLCTLAPSPIPVALLGASALSASPLFQGVTAQSLTTLVGDLGGFGLIEHRADAVDTITLHPLVREANRDQVDTVEHRDDFAAAQVAMIRRVVADLDGTDPAQWPLWRLLLPHCSQLSYGVPAVVHADRRSALDLASVQSGAADFCAAVGFGLQAEQFYRRALATRLDLLGPEHPETLLTRRNFAGMRRDRGELAAAEAEYRAILAVHLRVLGPEHPDTLTTRGDLATTLHHQGYLATAEVEYRDILAVHLRVLGPEHPDTLTTRSDLAWTLHHQGYPETAEAEYRDILAVHLRVLGPEHPDTLTTRDNLASTLRLRGDLATAEAEYRDILALRESVLGPEHLDTLTTRNHLASTFHKRGEFAAAEVEYRDVLAIQQRVFGPEHPHTLLTRNNLASTLRSRGDLDVAEVEYRDILALRERVLGPDHPDTLTTRNILAWVISRTKTAPRVVGPEEDG